MLSEENYVEGKKDGPFITYHKNGKILEEKHWKNDTEEGTWEQFFENGTVKTKGKYVHGFLEGKITFYFPGGKPHIEGVYRDAVRDSTWNYYKENGELDYTEKYHLGTLKEGKREEDLLTPEEIEKAKLDYEKENELYKIIPEK